MKYLSFIEKYKSKMGKPIGIDNIIISEIEKHFQLDLPLAYKEYLLNFGANSGNLLSSYYMTYPSLMDNKSDVFEMINFDDRKLDSEKPKIESNFFFFGQWQGYNFFFFECGIGENPPVKILNDSFEIIGYKDSFTSFLIEEGLNNL
jgi:SMI1-KNR4 cell-wall